MQATLKSLMRAASQDPLRCGVCGTFMVPDKTVETFRCPACGFFASALPVRINSFDRLDEEARETGLKSLRLSNFRQMLAECMDVLPSRAKLLDVGCAHGWFIEAAKERGLICSGIEPDRGMAARATASGHNVLEGLFPDAVPAGARYDAITFNDVFEHLPDVEAISRKLADFLEPGGVVIINLPMADGPIFRLARLAARFRIRGPLNRMWQTGLPSPHLSYFSAATLVRLFAQAGFSIVRQGQLQSIALDGLYQRIRYDRSTGAFKAAALYGAALCTCALVKFFPSDIQYFVFRLPACQ